MGAISRKSQRVGRCLRICLLSSALLALAGIVAPVAFADSLWGSWGVFTDGGVGYQARSAVTVFDDGSGATARTTLQTQTGQLVPAEWMYIRPRLFNGPNQLMEGDIWYYNPSPASVISQATSPKSPNHGYYYDKGLVSAYSSYAQRETLWSGLLHNPL